MLQYLQTKILKNIDFYLFLVIVLVVFWVYYPSLWHAPRADQLIYLNWVSDLDNLKSLLLDNYAPNRVVGGDPILFRPILFFLLGFEKWLFGYQFEYWQLTGILLHLLVLFILFYLLKFKPESWKGAEANFWSRFWAFGITLLFGIQSVSMELVVWHHVNGYLLFTFFLLGGILFLRYFLFNGNYIFWVLSFGFIFCSAFTYELGNIAGLLIACYLLLLNIVKPLNQLKFFNALPFLIIPILYIGLSLFDLYHRGYTQIDLPQIDSSTNMTQESLRNFPFKPVINHILIYILAWFMKGIIPDLYELRAGGRISFDISSNFIPEFSSQSIFLAILLMFLILILPIARKVNTQKIKQEFFYLMLWFFLIFAYVGVIIYGRSLERGFHFVFVNNSYYSYISNIFVFILIYKFISLCTNPRPLQKRVKQFFLFYLIFIFSFVSILNGYSVYAMNIKMVEFSQPYLSIFSKTVKTIQTHSKEADFAFKVEDDCASNPVLDWLSSSSLIEAIWPRFYDEVNFKYVVPCNVRLLNESYKGFSIIRVDSSFYAILQDEGEFSLEKIEKEQYSHLFLGNSIEELKTMIDNVNNVNLVQDIGNRVKLVMEGYRGFNIIQTGSRFYAILQAEGAFSLERIEQKDYSRFFIGDSIEEVKMMIDNQ